MAAKALASSEYDNTVLSSPSVPRPVGARAPGDDPMLGAELAGSYRIDRVLSDGGMGRLYEAVHLRLARRLAIKVIHHPLAARDDLRARFEREARAMCRVRSDHVVDVVDMVPGPDGRMCLVTELLEGDDLDQYVRNRGGRLEQREAVALLRQCLRGLASAHALGVVHRDLKPANLYVAKDVMGNMTLKILDFGVAKMGDDAEVTSTGVIVGTPAYMAPEQARGAAHADARSDLYAAGAVLYRLLTGKSPYSDTDASGTLIRLMQEAPPRPSLIEKSISAGLEAVIEKAMARDPRERYQTADELDRALAPFDVGSALRSSTDLGSGVDEKALSRRARLVRPLAVLAGIGLALLAGAGVAAGLALLVHGLSTGPALNMTEFVLVLLGAGVAAAAAGMGVGRSLAEAFGNAAMVRARTKSFARAMWVGLTSYGILELMSALATAFGGAAGVASASLWAAARVFLALVVAACVALWASRGTR